MGTKRFRKKFVEIQEAREKWGGRASYRLGPAVYNAEMAANAVAGVKADLFNLLEEKKIEQGIYDAEISEIERISQIVESADPLKRFIKGERQ